jgi:hypothetical protein
MSPPFSIDRQTGSILIGETIFLEPAEHKDSVRPKVRHLVDGSQDHGNGFEWLYLHQVTFGGHPARLSLCFHDDLLEQASWSVQLPHAENVGGWPTLKAIDAEVEFVLRTLRDQMDIHPGRFSWGEVWSSFDARGFMAANGLRYRPSRG